jgi:hypothetical protein
MARSGLRPVMRGYANAFVTPAPTARITSWPARENDCYSPRQGWHVLDFAQGVSPSCRCAEA